MAQTAQGKGLLSHSRLESKVPTVLTPSQQHLLCFWGKKEQDAPTSWNKEKIKKARYGFHISDCLQTLYLWGFSFQN